MFVFDGFSIRFVVIRLICRNSSMLIWLIEFYVLVENSILFVCNDKVFCLKENYGINFLKKKNVSMVV